MTLFMGRISPMLLLAIFILAAIFFVFGLLHLLFRFLTKRSLSLLSQSNGDNETTSAHAIQRQLQQLFELHDSGLDQALIDELPLFYYQDVVGANEPFDCAVCLCEFADQDTLRLIPLCGHAFHIDCIDTWLLTNSTCPLCRSHISSEVPIPNPLFDIDGSRERWDLFHEERDGKNRISCDQKAEIMQENVGEKRVFSIRLGKLRGIKNEVEIEDGNEAKEISGCNLDGRRCYSMGTFQYVVGTEMQVTLSIEDAARMKSLKSSICNGEFGSSFGDQEGKKISRRSRGESYSVSKIWLWPKKEGSQKSIVDTNTDVTSLDFV